MTPETVAPGISPAYGLPKVDALAGNFRLAAGEQTHELPGQVRRPDDPAFGGVVAAVALAGGTLVLGLDGFLARGGHLKELVVGMGAAYGREFLGMAAPRNSRSQARINAAACGPPTDWGDLVQMHDDRDAIQASPAELSVIDIYFYVLPLRSREDRSRGSHEAHQPGNACGGAIDRAIPYALTTCRHDAWKTIRKQLSPQAISDVWASYLGAKGVPLLADHITSHR
jgi:hypothetical protein